jgi:hypothetical protein
MDVPNKGVKNRNSGFQIPNPTSTMVITESIPNTFQINAVCE